MKCPLCGGRLDTNDTRTFNSTVNRKRECTECLTQFTTTEKINYEKLPRYILDKLHEKVEMVGR